MKTYIKLVVLALCATIAVSLSAQTAPFSNEMPSQWAQNKPIEKKAQRYVAPQQYQSPTLGKGSNYNAVTTETARRANTPTSATLLQNNGSNYYRSYGIDNAGSQNVTYNEPAAVVNRPTTASERAPFEELSSNGMTRVSREETPDDPAPIGDAVLPMLIFALLWVAIKFRIKK